jgi:hypothetical protein
MSQWADGEQKELLVSMRTRPLYTSMMMRCALAPTQSPDRASICDKSLVLTFFFCSELRAILARQRDRATTSEKSLVSAFFFFSNWIPLALSLLDQKAAKPARLLSSHFRSLGQDCRRIPGRRICSPRNAQRRYSAHSWYGPLRPARDSQRFPEAKPTYRY